MAPEGCQVLRITEEDDFTTQECVDEVIRAIQRWGEASAHRAYARGSGSHPGPGDTKSMLLWSSIPCTGGSTWQYVNEAVYLRSNNELALQRLRGLRNVFEKLWINFERVAEGVISGGGIS